jgi:hypothetical protein
VPPAPTAAGEEAALAERVAAERQRYEELKVEMQLWTIGFGAVCCGLTLAFYGKVALAMPDAIDASRAWEAPRSVGMYRKHARRKHNVGMLAVRHEAGCWRAAHN